MLTELEGAILTEIGHRQRLTAFRVRQAFKVSASSEWRGSAGSVYPAIKRLVERGFIVASPSQDKRGTQSLGVTLDGQKALQAWMLDIRQSLSIGMDPFRLRAGLWSQVQPDERAALFGELHRELEQAIADLLEYQKNQDALETIQIDLAIELQRTRLAWLKKWVTVDE